MHTFDIKSASFAGKWAFSTQSDSGIITLRKTDAGFQLVTKSPQGKQPDSNQMFNFYGSLQDGFILQAPNWLYVTYENGYFAKNKRENPGNAVFHLESIITNDETFVSIIETDQTGTKYYISVDAANCLIRKVIDKKHLDNSLFRQIKITDGLDKIRSQRSTMANPLTGVYLAGQDLRHISFQSTNLSDANLSDTILDKSSNFNGATAENTLFNRAKMDGWIANGLTFKNCYFLNTCMTNARLVSSRLNGCKFNKTNFKSSILQNSDFSDAELIYCSFEDAKINGIKLKGTSLINADFSKAIGINDIITIESANLMGADFSGCDFTKIRMDQEILFMNAKLDRCNFKGKDLSNMNFVRASMKNVNLDNSTLDGVQMTFANLSFASVNGAVSLIGANLSNTNLKNTHFQGAQLGAKNTLLSLELSIKDQLNKPEIPEVLKKSLKLSVNAALQVLIKDQNWQITDASKIFQINNTGTKLLVQTLCSDTSNTAVLTNAYMFNADFYQANLYAVEMSGVYWYGNDANAVGADLSLANLSNAFLSNMNFKQCVMQGISLDYSTLISTVFDGVNLNPTSTLKPSSFTFASMQSASFIATDLNAANLTNAAIAMEKGVPLFSINCKFMESLDNQKIAENLRSCFNEMGYPLAKCAFIRLIKKSENWRLNNIDSKNPSQTGYGNFYFEYTESGNGIHAIKIYGEPPLLISCKDGNGGQTQLPLTFGITQIDPDQMNEDTTCPSGIRKKFLSDYLSFEELMTAALPPKPPTSIDDW